MICYKFIDDMDNRHKIQHEAGIELLKSAVNSGFGIQITEEDISKSKCGKPFLPEHPDICFNISHCSGLCSCIVLRGSECGIDCERIRSVRERIVDRIMNDNERTHFFSLPIEERNAHFFVLWTLKEAYGKFTGGGIADMKKVSFTFEGNVLISNHSELCFKVFQRGDHILSVCTPHECSDDIATDFGLQIY